MFSDIVWKKLSAESLRTTADWWRNRKSPLRAGAYVWPERHCYLCATVKCFSIIKGHFWGKHREFNTYIIWSAMEIEFKEWCTETTAQVYSKQACGDVFRVEEVETGSDQIQHCGLKTAIWFGILFFLSQTKGRRCSFLPAWQFWLNLKPSSD